MWFNQTDRFTYKPHEAAHTKRKKHNKIKHITVTHTHKLNRIKLHLMGNSNINASSLTESVLHS